MKVFIVVSIDLFMHESLNMYTHFGSSLASSSFLPVSLQSSYNVPPVAYAPTKKFQLSDAEIEKCKKITQDIKTNTADAKKSAESKPRVCDNAPSVSRL